MNRHRQTGRQMERQTGRQMERQTQTKTEEYRLMLSMFNCVFVDDKISRTVKVAKGCRDCARSCLEACLPQEDLKFPNDFIKSLLRPVNLRRTRNHLVIENKFSKTEDTHTYVPYPSC